MESSVKASRRTILVPAALAGLLLAACSGPSQVTLPDGSVAYRIDCGPSARDMNFCFEKAGKSCGAEGYRIVGNNGELLGNSEVAASDSVRVVKAWQADRNSIYISCGA